MTTSEDSEKEEIEVRREESFAIQLKYYVCDSISVSPSLLRSEGKECPCHCAYRIQIDTHRRM